jgi:carbonic anhydrase
MRLLKTLFDNNEKWASDIRERDPEFFERLARQQAPEFLWIGCSDSRVPANEITGLMPGEVFVHRNIANIVPRSDTNCLAVIQYAVNVLRVRHIMVVGHYGCGGVKAALDGADGLTLVGQWLEPIREIAREHCTFLRNLPDEQTRWDRLCELNVIGQVHAVAETGIVREAWAKGIELAVHGWIYGVHNGRLRDVNVTIASPNELRIVHEQALSAITGG